MNYFRSYRRLFDFLLVGILFLTVSLSVASAWPSVSAMTQGEAALQSDYIVRIGSIEPNGRSEYPVISADGRYIAFASDASNLVPDDTNGVTDIFVYARETGEIERVSISSDGTQGDNPSWGATDISADGRYVFFQSAATTLVEGDTNKVTDIFVRDRQLNITTRLSVSSSGAQVFWGHSTHPSASADGQVVTFYSEAVDLIDGSWISPEPALYVHDRQTGETTEIVLANGNGSFGAPTVSDDGRYVLFPSNIANLVPQDTDASIDIFMYDRQNSTTTLISVSSSGENGNLSSYAPRISSDNAYVAFFSSATNLVSGDSNHSMDAFVRDLSLGQTTRISVTSNGVEANGHAGRGALSDDGRYVVFSSQAANMNGDGTIASQIYRHDHDTGETRLVSVDGSSAPGNSFSFLPSISADGRFVAFQSNASNLVGGDTNGVEDIYIVDLAAPGLPTPPEPTPEVTPVVTPEPPSEPSCDPNADIVRVSANPDGSAGYSFPGYQSLSADGRYFIFDSNHDLTPDDAHNGGGTYLYDRLTCQYTRLPFNAGNIRMSANGRYFAFEYYPNNLVPEDTNNFTDIYVYDRTEDTFTLVSVSVTGMAGNNESYVGMISADGRYVTFNSSATDLVEGDVNDYNDTFLRDLHTGETFLTSLNADGEQVKNTVNANGVSGDGRYLTFQSNLLDLDEPYGTEPDCAPFFCGPDLNFRDRISGETVRLNQAPMYIGPFDTTLSADGRYAAYGANEFDSSGLGAIFIYDHSTGQREMLTFTPDGSRLNGHVSTPILSADGRFVVFASDASNIVAGDTNDLPDVFIHDLTTGETARIQSYLEGEAPIWETYYYYGVFISDDGTYLSFASESSGLVPGDYNDDLDVFLIRNPFMPEITPEPTDEPTPEVTAEPTEEPTPEVTAEPTPEVTAEPTEEPTPEVTAEPSEEPTPEITPTVSPDDAVPLRNLFTTGTPRLYWNRITWARGYHLQVSSSLNFSAPLYERTVGRNTLAAIVTLGDQPLPDGTYYWRVRAKRADGTWGRWSPPDTFTIDTNEARIS